MIRILLVILLSTVAGASPSCAKNGTAGGDPTRPIQTTARIEVARLLAAEAAAEPVAVVHQTQPRRRNWVQRHPVWTAAMVGFGSGFPSATCRVTTPCSTTTSQGSTAPSSAASEPAPVHRSSPSFRRCVGR